MKKSKKNLRSIIIRAACVVCSMLCAHTIMAQDCTQGKLDHINNHSDIPEAIINFYEDCVNNMIIDYNNCQSKLIDNSGFSTVEKDIKKAILKLRNDSSAN